MNWIDVAPNRSKWRTFVNAAVNLRLPVNAGKFLSYCTIGGQSSAQLHGVSFVTIFVLSVNCDILGKGH
jgi:hypothetical protein